MAAGLSALAVFRTDSCSPKCHFLPGRRQPGMAAGYGSLWQQALRRMATYQRPELPMISCEALGLLAVMRQAELLPNVIAYGVAISACEKGHQWQQGHNL